MPTFAALVTLLAVILYFITSWQVGAARGKFGVKAPATTGNADFGISTQSGSAGSRSVRPLLSSAQFYRGGPSRYSGLHTPQGHLSLRVHLAADKIPTYDQP